MNRILLVTGGAGFIGANFVHYWRETYPDDRVIVLDALTYAGNLDNLAPVWNDPHFRFYPGRIEDPTVVNGLFRCEKITHVLNFAAESHNDRSMLDPTSLIATNVTGPTMLLEAVRRYGAERMLHVSCYDAQARALTKDGLKHYWEIAEGDKVLSLNPQTGLIEEKEIEKVIVQDYEGDMIHFNSNRIDLLVTPNHRMLYTVHKKPDTVRMDAAQDLFERTNIYLPKGKWSGIVSETLSIDGLGDLPTRDVFYLAGVFIGDGFLAVQTQRRPNKTGLPRAEYLKQARDSSGKFINPGRLGTNDHCECTCYRIFLDVPESDKARTRLEAALCRLGIQWYAHRGKAGQHIYFSSRAWAQFFEQFGKGFACKHIPAWMLEYDTEYLQCLFDGLMDSDGHYAPAGQPRFSTSSLSLVAGVCELGFKLGILPRFSIRKANRTVLSSGRVISGSCPAYMVFFRTENVGIHKQISRYEAYRGKIWCLKVRDNKNFIVERGGILAFCGNTDEVYGEIGLGAFKETDPLEPRTPYSAPKAGGEMQVRAHRIAYGTPTVVTRGSNTFGPYQFPEKLLPFFITRAMQNKKLPLYGAGDQVRDWIFVRDHCAGIATALLKGGLGEAYNVGGGNERTNIEVTRKVLFLLGKPETLIKRIGDPRGEAHDKRYALNSEKLRALGWAPKRTFEEALEETVLWYVEHEAWWRSIVESAAYQSFVARYYGPYLGEDL